MGNYAQIKKKSCSVTVFLDLAVIVVVVEVVRAQQ